MLVRPLALFLALACLAAGCTKPKNSVTPSKEEAHEGLHGGFLFASPDHKYHLEFKRESEKIYLWVLDGQARKEVPIEAPSLTVVVKESNTRVECKADPETPPKAGEKAKSSRFSAAADKLGKEVKPDKLEIEGEIDGKAYTFRPDK